MLLLPRLVFALLLNCPPPLRHVMNLHPSPSSRPSSLKSEGQIFQNEEHPTREAHTVGMPGRMDSEMQTVLERLRTSSITMADIRRCRRIHLQDKICTNSIAKELGLSVDIVEAACWAPPAAASAYNTFVAESRQHLSGSWGDVLKEAGSMWKQLDANTRARFESQAAGSNQAARVRLEQWESALEGLEVSKDDAPVDVGPSREERKAQIKAEQQLQDASRIERERALVRALSDHSTVRCCGVGL